MNKRTAKTPAGRQNDSLTGIFFLNLKNMAIVNQMKVPKMIKMFLDPSSPRTTIKQNSQPKKFNASYSGWLVTITLTGFSDMV